MKHRLKEVLKDCGIKQTQLAELVGTSDSVISDLMRGVLRLNEDWIEKICNALNIPAWYLFADPKTVLDENDRELVSRIRALPKQGQEKIWEEIKFWEWRQDQPQEEMTLHEKAGPGYKHKEDKGKKI